MKGSSFRNSLNEQIKTSKSVLPEYVGAPRSKFDYNLLYCSNSLSFYECIEVLAYIMLEGVDPN